MCFSAVICSFSPEPCRDCRHSWTTCCARCGGIGNNAGGQSAAHVFSHNEEEVGLHPERDGGAPSYGCGLYADGDSDLVSSCGVRDTYVSIDGQTGRGHG